MTCLRAACGVLRLDGMRSEKYMNYLECQKTAVEVNNGVVKWVDRSALMWYGHVRRMPKKRMVKKGNRSDMKGLNIRDIPPMSLCCKTEQH